MSNLIFCKFLNTDGNPRGRNYTYRTDIDVNPGDYVLVEVVNSSCSAVQKKVVVTKTDVSPDDIPGYESFKDKIKTIIGLASSDEKPEKPTNSADEDIPVVNMEDL